MFVPGLQLLFRRPLKQAAATTREKGIATKKQGCLLRGLCIIGNVSSRMPRNVDCEKAQALPTQCAALFHGLMFKTQFFVGGSIDLGTPFPLEGAHATGVVAVVMRD